MCEGVTNRLQDEINNIPLADEDAAEDLSDIESSHKSCQRFRHEQSIESIPSVYTNGNESPVAAPNCISIALSKYTHLLPLKLLI